MILIEKNTKFATALDRRMEYLQELKEFKNLNYEVYQGDCNKILPEILNNEIKNKERRSTHCLVFIDPYGMDIYWDTTKMLLEIRSDLIFTLQTFLIGTRATGRARKDEDVRETMKKFFGEENFTSDLILNSHLLSLL